MYLGYRGEQGSKNLQIDITNTASLCSCDKPKVSGGQICFMQDSDSTKLLSFETQSHVLMKEADVPCSTPQKVLPFMPSSLEDLLEYGSSRKAG